MLNGTYFLNLSDKISVYTKFQCYNTDALFFLGRWRATSEILLFMRIGEKLAVFCTFLTQTEGQVGPLQAGSQMYGILTVQSECASALLLSLPAAFRRRHRSVDKFAGFMWSVRRPFGTISLREHHAYEPSTSHWSPSFAPEVQNFKDRLSSYFDGKLLSINKISIARTSRYHLQKAEKFSNRIKGQQAHVHRWTESSGIRDEFMFLKLKLTLITAYNLFMSSIYYMIWNIALSCPQQSRSFHKPWSFFLQIQLP